MSSGRDPGVPERTGEQPGREAADDQPPAVAAAGQPGAAAFTDAEFVGPLLPTDQAWSEHTLRADTSAALFEPADNVIRRREAHISGLYRMATLLTLSGDLGGGGAAGFRAIAESRALAEFLAGRPDYCLDCFLLAGRCQRHQPGRPAPDGSSGSGSVGSGSVGSGSVGSGSAGSGSVGSGSAGAGSDSDDARPAGSGSVDRGAGSTARPRSTGGRPAGMPGSSTPGAGRKAPGHQPGHEPEWRRFGADEFPSASG